MNAPYINNVFFHSNEVMNELPDNSVCLIITSPPYWDIKDYSKTGGELGQEIKHSESDNADMGSIKSYQDYIDRCLITWKECYRVLKPGGKFCLNIPTINRKGRSIGSYSISYDMRKNILENTKFKFFNLIVWNKTTRPPPFTMGSFPFPLDIYTWFGMTEDIIVFVKPGEFPDMYDEDRWRRSAMTEKEFYEIINPVWNIRPPLNRTEEHSAVMSLEIVSRLVKAYSLVESLVLDPFTGSGTTLKGAKLLGRNWVGYELYPFYKNVIERNLGVKLGDNGLTTEKTDEKVVKESKDEWMF